MLFFLSLSYKKNLGEIKMYREPIRQFVKEGILYVPKNGGLNDYVLSVLMDAGIEQSELTQRRFGNVQLVSCRGEDISQRVTDQLKKGNPAYGLTGDDLFDEFCLEKGTPENITVINTYDWLDEKAKFGRPALCLLNRTGEIADVVEDSAVAVNKKYTATSRRYLDDRFKENRFLITEYSGGTEDTFIKKTNSVVVEIVYGGDSAKEAKLRIAEVIRVCDISLIGKRITTNS